MGIQDNKLLDRLIKGFAVEFTEASKEVVDALEILNGDCCYKHMDFSDHLYWNYNKTVAVIVW